MYIVKLYLFIMFCVDLLSMPVEHEEVYYKYQFKFNF